MMKKWILNAGKLMIAASIVMTTACNKDDDDNGNKDTGPGNLLAVAKANVNTRLYAQAIEEAELGSRINANNRTLFAPSDLAFEAYLSDLGFDNVEDWVSVTRADIVEQVLLYHVLDQENEAGDLSSGYHKTLAVNASGNNLDLYVSGGNNVTINGDDNSVVDADIEASNGTMHIINGMLQPRTVAGLLEVNNNFSLLRDASDHASGNIMATLNNNNTTYSILAPNNAAFYTFFGEEGINNLSMVDPASLQDILDYHILRGDIREDNFSDSPFNTNLSGASITISENNSGNYQVVDGQSRTASFFDNDITAINGTIHIISNVMLHED